MKYNLPSFIDNSPTAFHAVKNIGDELTACGFTQLKENEVWNISENGKYYVVRNSSSIIAFTVGKEFRFNIAASHTDSPCFRIKPEGELKCGCYTKLNTEGYGGIILSSWLDRPLTFAGRVFLDTPDGLKEVLVFPDKTTLIIPNVAIHLNREINNGYKYDRRIDMCPLFSADENADILTYIAAEIGCNPDVIISTELNVVNNEKAKVWGVDDEFISAPRLDDLQCVWSSLSAFLETESDAINVFCCFDNEEVGSSTKQGAASTFLYDVLERITEKLNKSHEEFHIAIDNSFMLSADNAHAVHPNHPELTDEKNKCNLNGGVVIKENASQKYMSDGYSIAYVKKLCKDNGIPFSVFANRSDIAGGSTLGNISNSQVSLKGADIGIAQLAMHSAYETAGYRDTFDMVNLFKAFYGE